MDFTYQPVERYRAIMALLLLTLMLLIRIDLKTFQSSSKGLIQDSSKLKKFADYDFRFDENVRKFSKWVENAAGKGEIARYAQYLLFP